MEEQTSHERRSTAQLFGEQNADCKRSTRAAAWRHTEAAAAAGHPAIGAPFETRGECSGGEERLKIKSIRARVASRRRAAARRETGYLRGMAWIGMDWNGMEWENNPTR